MHERILVQSLLDTVSSKQIPLSTRFMQGIAKSCSSRSATCRAHSAPSKRSCMTFSSCVTLDRCASRWLPLRRGSDTAREYRRRTLSALSVSLDTWSTPTGHCQRHVTCVTRNGPCLKTVACTHATLDVHIGALPSIRWSPQSVLASCTYTSQHLVHTSNFLTPTPPQTHTSISPRIFGCGWSLLCQGTAEKMGGVTSGCAKPHLLEGS